MHDLTIAFKSFRQLKLAGRCAVSSDYAFARMRVLFLMNRSPERGYSIILLT